jgi:hypothetical protein
MSLQPLRLFSVVMTVHCLLRPLQARCGPNRFHVSAQGDNNRGDDRVLYAAGQDWLHHPDKHIMGRVVGCVQDISAQFGTLHICICCPPAAIYSHKTHVRPAPMLDGLAAGICRTWAWSQ